MGVVIIFSLMALYNIRKIIRKKERQRNDAKHLKALDAYLAQDSTATEGQEGPVHKPLAAKQAELKAKQIEDKKEYQERFGYVVNPIAQSKTSQKSSAKLNAAVNEQSEAWRTEQAKPMEVAEVEMGGKTMMLEMLWCLIT